MEWTDKLFDIISYVEEHLQRKEEPIDIEEIAKIAGCSYPFFQKVFSYMNGISFAEYIRLRKLTLAGYDVKSTSAKIIDISYKYGYDSPTSFTKAFQKFHGISPQDARNQNADLQVYPRMQFPIKQNYTWRIEQKEAVRMLGKCISLSDNDEQNYLVIPAFWDQCQRDGTFASILSLDTALHKGMYGFQQNQMYYLMCASTLDTPTGFTEMMLPAQTWAVFDCYGRNPEAIQNGWKFLYHEWLVKYPFQHADCPAIEWYSDNNTFDENYLSQIWIPIIEEVS